MSIDDDDDEADSFDDEEEGGTEQCPYCGAEIYEGVEQCPKCGQYLSDEEGWREGRRRRKIPIWVIAGTVLAILGTLAWVLG